MQGDIVGIYDLWGGKLASYTYDAWGNFTVTYHNGGGSTSVTKNPLTYRGYYYDQDLGLYYLNARYYDSKVGRWINADGFVSTGQGLIGNNMFSYCGNNPIMRVDTNGQFWNSISKFFTKIKEWAMDTFGAGYTSYTTIAETETSVIPDPLPITLKTGTYTKEETVSIGDSSKPISVYASKDEDHIIKSSSIGLNINISNFNLNVNIGFDDIGISGSYSNGNSVDSFGARINVSELKVGLETSNTVRWDCTMQTTYTNMSVSGWAILATYYLATTGQVVASPASIY